MRKSVRKPKLEERKPPSMGPICLGGWCWVFGREGEDSGSAWIDPCFGRSWSGERGRSVVLIPSMIDPRASPYRHIQRGHPHAYVHTYTYMRHTQARAHTHTYQETDGGGALHPPDVSLEVFGVGHEEAQASDLDEAVADALVVFVFVNECVC